METYIKIPTTDWLEIKWVLNSKEKSDKLIIFVHGLTGSMTEAHYYAAKEFFISKWYDVYRFNLYAGWETTRDLHTCSIKDHSIDIKQVMNYFESSYKSIDLVWHSLAGPSIVGINNFIKNINKIVYWDPAFDTSWTILRCIEKNWTWFFDPRNWKNIAISHDMYIELKDNIHLHALQDMKFKKENMYIIFAGECDKINFKNQTDDMWIESCIIEWANHWFTQEWKYEELFEKTLEYIKK